MDWTERSFDDAEAQAIAEWERQKKAGFLPAAKVISRHPQSQERKQSGQQNGEALSTSQEKDKVGVSVMGEVVERRNVVEPIVIGTRLAPAGFPIPFHRKGESAFARRLSSGQKLSRPAAPVLASASSAAPTLTSSAQATPAALKEIGEMNARKVASMSVEEIRSAQDEIRAAFPSDLLEGLKRRGLRKSSEVGGQRLPGASETGSHPLPVPLERIRDEAQLQEAIKSLPPDERIKAAWMEDIEEGDIEVAAQNPTAVEARVDLSGMVVCPGVSVPMSAGLHHHGDSPTAAGYTPSELVHLSRSVMSNQRTLALRAIVGLLKERAKAIGEGLDPAHAQLPEQLPSALRLAADSPSERVAELGLEGIWRFAVDLMEESSWASWLQWGFLPPGAPPLRPQCTPEECIGLDWLTEQEEAGVGAADTENSEISGWDAPLSSAGAAGRACFRDPIKGFVSMGIIPCLVANLCTSSRSDGSSSPTSLFSLRILIAIARRGLDGAARVATAPGLMEVMTQQLLGQNKDGMLPLSLSGTGRPPESSIVVWSCRLARALVEGGRAVAEHVCAHGLLSSGIGLLGLKGKGSEELQSAKMEVLGIWNAFLRYGLACDAVGTVLTIVEGGNSILDRLGLGVPCPLTSTSEGSSWTSVSGAPPRLSSGLYLCLASLSLVGERASPFLAIIEKVVEGVTSRIADLAVKGLLDPTDQLQASMMHFLAAAGATVPAGLASALFASHAFAKAGLLVSEAFSDEQLRRVPTSCSWLCGSFRLLIASSKGEGLLALSGDAGAMSALVSMARTALEFRSRRHTMKVFCARPLAVCHYFCCVFLHETIAGAGNWPSVVPGKAVVDGYPIAAASLLGPGDEYFASRLVSLSLGPMEIQGAESITETVVAMFADRASLKSSRLRLTGEGADQIPSLVPVTGPRGAIMLPLPAHWLLLPLPAREKASLDAVVACLCALDGCSSYNPPPETELYYTLAFCSIRGSSIAAHSTLSALLCARIARLARTLDERTSGSSLAISLEAAAIEGDLRRHRRRSTQAGPPNFGQALQELVEDICRSFLADSCGDAALAAALCVFLRTSMPARARVVVWREVGGSGLLRLLSQPLEEEGADDFVSAFMEPVDSDFTLVYAYVEALRHPRFCSREEGGRLFDVACCHVARYILGGQSETIGDTRLRMLERLSTGPSGARPLLSWATESSLLGEECKRRLGDALGMTSDFEKVKKEE